MAANVAVIVEGIHWIGSLLQSLRAVHFFATLVRHKAGTGTFHASVSTIVEVAQTEMKVIYTWEEFSKQGIIFL